MTTNYTPTQFTGNPTTTQINAELRRIRDALDNTLQRVDQTANGVTQINQMELGLDMNSNPIMNVVSDPDDPTSLVTQADLANVSGIEGASQLQDQIDVIITGISDSNVSAAAQRAQIQTQLQTQIDTLITAVQDTNLSSAGQRQILQDQIDTLVTNLSDSNISNANQLAAAVASLQTQVDALNNTPTTTAELFEKSFSFYGTDLPVASTLAGFPLGQNAFLIAIQVHAIVPPTTANLVLSVTVDGVNRGSAVITPGNDRTSEAFFGGGQINAGSIIQLSSGTIGDAEGVSATMLFNGDT